MTRKEFSFPRRVAIHLPEVAKEVLVDIGADPVEQKNFPTTHREFERMLAELLDPCDAVLHIAGFPFGVEPANEPGQPCYLYTQWEYHRARANKNISQPSYPTIFGHASGLHTNGEIS